MVTKFPNKRYKSTKTYNYRKDCFLFHLLKCIIVFKIYRLHAMTNTCREVLKLFSNKNFILEGLRPSLLPRIIRKREVSLETCGFS